MKQQVEVFFHSQQPYTSVQEADLAQYPSGRLDFPNRYFDPVQAHALYRIFRLEMRQLIDSKRQHRKA